MLERVPVVIVGGGPVGMTAALLLARVGVQSVVVEKRRATRPDPQAHVIKVRSVEILRSLGLEGDLRAASTPPEQIRYVTWVDTLAGTEIGRFDLFACPEARAAVGASPSAPANIPQNILEPIIDRHLAEADQATMLRGWECVGVQQDQDRVSVRIAGPGGEARTLHADFLIACDGANSSVREALDIPMDGVDEMARFLMINCRGDLRPYAERRPSVLYWNLDPASAGTFIVHAVASSFVYMYPFKADESDLSLEQAREVLQRAVGDQAFEFEILSRGRWIMRRQLARRYRQGRILLAGDAVHRFPPTGGLGMNTGFNDVHNLVWKLKAVLDGWAPAIILDSYQAEAKPVAEANADLSLSNAQRMVEIPAALGLTGGAAADREVLDRYAAVAADDPWRARVQSVIDDQTEHFVTPGADLGRCYQSAIVIDDDESQGVPIPEAVAYQASTYPGIRLPHVVVERDGEALSVLDLIDYHRFTLLLGAAAAAVERWADAGQLAAAATGVPLHLVQIGPGTQVQDSKGDWSRLRGVGEDGAVLVRPDGHVAWRSDTAAGAGRLTQVLGVAAGQRV